MKFSLKNAFGAVTGAALAFVPDSIENSVGKAVHEIGGAVKDAGAEISDAVSEAVSGVNDSVRKEITEVRDHAWNSTRDALQAAADDVTELGSDIKDGVDNYLDDVAYLGDHVVETVVDFTDEKVHHFNQGVDVIEEMAGDAYDSFAESVEFAGNVVEAIPEAALEVAHEKRDALLATIDSSVDGFKADVKSSLNEGAENLGQLLAGLVGTLLDSLESETGQQLVTSFQEGMEQRAAEVSNAPEAGQSTPVVTPAGP